MKSKFTLYDYYRMPFFPENWVSFSVAVVVVFALWFLLFKKEKISFLYAFLVSNLVFIPILPVQSYLTIKTWMLSEKAVVYGVFPLSALLVSAASAYCFFRLRLRFSKQKTNRKKQQVKRSKKSSKKAA